MNRTMTLPAVGDSAAVAAHAQALLQVRGKAGGSDAPAAVGTHTLFILPLVVHLTKDVNTRLVHDFCPFETQSDQDQVLSEVTPS